MPIKVNICGLALWAGVAVGCAPRAYVVAPASADREHRMSGGGFASPSAVGGSSGAPSKVPSPEDKLVKQGSKPASERAASSLDFTAAIGSKTDTQEQETVEVTPANEVAVALFSGNEAEHIKFAKYDPFGSNGSFEVVLDGLAYTYPIAGKFSSGYGARGRSMHSGVDLVAAAGTPIYAVFDGVVRLSKPYSGYGNVIVLRHANGLETVYSHNAKNLVRVGQSVKQGDQIAECGRTGRATTNHLHFEVRVQGATINPTLLLDVQARTLQSGVLRVARSGGGAISARRVEGKSQPQKPAETPAEVSRENKEVRAAAPPTTQTTTATTTVSAVAVASEPEPNKPVPPASATASRGIRVGDKVYDVAPSSSDSAPVYHTVAKGETLSAIARKYGTSWQKISKLNRWTPEQADKINAGKKIRVQ